jgi:hypothetical protein
MEGSGQPLSDNQCLIGAAICGGIALFMLAGVWFPRLRLGFLWEGTNRRCSSAGSLGWSLFFAAFAILLVASGVHYSPISEHAGWIVGFGGLALVLAFIHDHTGNQI